MDSKGVLDGQVTDIAPIQATDVGYVFELVVNQTPVVNPRTRVEVVAVSVYVLPCECSVRPDEQSLVVYRGSVRSDHSDIGLGVKRTSEPDLYVVVVNYHWPGSVTASKSWIGCG